MLETLIKETQAATIISKRSASSFIVVMAHPSYSDSIPMQEGRRAEPAVGVDRNSGTMPGMDAERHALLMIGSAVLCVDFMGMSTGMMMR